MELDYVYRILAVLGGLAIFAHAMVRIAWEFWAWGIMVLHDEKPILSNQIQVDVRMEIWFASLGASMVLWQFIGGGGK